MKKINSLKMLVFLFAVGVSSISEAHSINVCAPWVASSSVYGNAQTCIDSGYNGVNVDSCFGISNIIVACQCSGSCLGW